MKKMAFFVLILFLFFSTTLNVYGGISTGLETVPMNINEKRDNFYLCETRCYSSASHGMFYIKNIAVNSDGTIVAIGLSNEKIEIYDTAGNFIRGYKLNAGQGFGLEFDTNDDRLCIYLARNELIYKIDEHGNILTIDKVKDTEENALYTSNLLNNTEEKKENYNYSIHGIGWINYECVLEASNKKVVIYSRKTQVILSIIFIQIVVLLLMLLAGILVFKAFYNYEEDAE